MKAESCRIVLRPRAPLETIDLAHAFVRQNGRALLRPLVRLVLPLWLPMAVLAWLLDGHPALLLLPLPFLDLVQIPFTRLGGRLLFDPEGRSPLRELASMGSLRLLGARLLALLALLASCGTVLPVLPALCFLPETVLLERVPLKRAVSRSARLAAREPLATMLSLVSRLAVTVWMALVVEALGQALLGTVLQLGAPFGAATSGQVTPFLLLGVLLAQPLHALYRLLLYIDVRTRAEGWDLQVALYTARRRREGDR